MSASVPHTYPKNKWTIALAVTVGTLMGAIDTSIVNVALPHLRGTLSASVEEITWVSTGYVLASVIIMPLTAWLGTRYGRKRVYMAGLTLFLIGSFFCGAARSLEVLVVFRVIQGLGAGSLQPTEQAILRETFPPHEQGMAMALYAFAIIIGPAFGPTLGGYIVDNYSWPWIFYINIPVGLFGLVSVWRVVHDPPYLERSKGKIDYIGLSLLVVGLGALQTVLEKGEDEGWYDSTFIIVCTAVAIFGIVMFIAHELVTDVPVVQLRVLRDRSFTMATIIGAVLGAVLFSTLFLLPLYMQEFLRFNAVQTGLALMPRSLVMAVTIPIVGAIYNRTSPKVVIAVGLALGALSCFQMSRFTLDTSSQDILWPQMVQGVALSCIFIPLSTVALATIDRRRMSEATGLNSLVRQLGGSFGVAIFASLLGRYTHQARITLASHLVVSDPAVQARVAMMKNGFMAGGADAVTATDRALKLLDGQVMAQGSMLAFERAFQLGGLTFACAIPLVLLLDAPKLGAKQEVSHEHAAMEV